MYSIVSNNNNTMHITKMYETVCGKFCLHIYVVRVCNMGIEKAHFAPLPSATVIYGYISGANCS